MTDSILWRRLDCPGHEIGSIALRDGRWELLGTAIFVHERAACKLDYVVVCDSSWRTQSARVSGRIGDREVNLVVSVTTGQEWHLNGTDCPTVSGCVDIDLGFSPSRNLLPIRRLALDVGEDASVNAAWLPFPSLVFERLPQMYRREGEKVYRYESGGGTFVRVLEVNDVGFVSNYPSLWRAEWAT